MTIKRINELPEGSGTLTNDDVFVFMDNPSGSGITKQISLSQIAAAIGASSSNEASSLITNVFNKTGSPIPKMTAVYINGGQGDQPTVSLAQANGESTSSKTYGLTAETIGNMSAGKVIVFGALSGLNTDQFNPTAPTGNVNGTTLYLSPTVAGGLTTTKPSAPNHMVAIGTIIRTHQNEGIIEVRVQNGFELEELHNVAISGVSNGQYLQYNSSSNTWVPNYIHSVVQLGSVSGAINTNANSGSIFDLTLAASGTLSNPTNGVDGQTLRWRITYGGSGIPLSLDTNFKIPTSASSPLPFSTGSGVMDILGATYDASRNKWDVIAFVPGY